MREYITKEQALRRFSYFGREIPKDIVIGVIASVKEDIVRCEDCKHAYYADNRIPQERTWVCERFMNEEINANDFCSFGERRDNERYNIDAE